MNSAPAKRRPKYLNLIKIRLPLPGVLSILHRVSGAVLIGALPFALAALQYSIASAEDYGKVVSLFGSDGHPLLKLCALGAAWSLFHHLCAGARFLLLDFHIGLELQSARATAWIAFAVSIALTIAFGVWLW